MRNWFRRQPPIDIHDLIKPPRVIFEGFEGDTAKLKPQGVTRSDTLLRARAELGVGLAPPDRRSPAVRSFARSYARDVVRERERRREAR